MQYMFAKIVMGDVERLGCLLSDLLQLQQRNLLASGKCPKRVTPELLDYITLARDVQCLLWCTDIATVHQDFTC